MSTPTLRKTAIVVTAFAGLAVTAPPASAATALADCTARLDAQYWSWTARCTAPHTVTIRWNRRWYWLHAPSVIHTTSGSASREVVPGTPWSERNYPIPEQITVQLCMSAHQDSTLLIAPRTCHPWR